MSFNGLMNMFRNAMPVKKKPTVNGSIQLSKSKSQNRPYIDDATSNSLMNNVFVDPPDLSAYVTHLHHDPIFHSSHDSSSYSSHHDSGSSYSDSSSSYDSGSSYSDSGSCDCGGGGGCD